MRVWLHAESRRAVEEDGGQDETGMLDADEGLVSSTGWFMVSTGPL